MTLRIVAALRLIASSFANAREPIGRAVSTNSSIIVCKISNCLFVNMSFHLHYHSLASSANNKLSNLYFFVNKEVFKFTDFIFEKRYLNQFDKNHKKYLVFLVKQFFKNVAIFLSNILHTCEVPYVFFLFANKPVFRVV